MVRENDSHQASKLKAVAIDDVSTPDVASNGHFPSSTAVAVSSSTPSINTPAQASLERLELFRCHHTGCSALPFQTQYLLK